MAKTSNSCFRPFDLNEEGSCYITRGVYDGNDISEYTSQYYDENLPSLGITVAGVQVNEKNKNDVLGDGTVTYDNENYIITLNNAKIECSEGYVDGIVIERDKATIKLIGNNSISVTGNTIRYEPSYYGISLSIVGVDDSAKLTMATTNEYACGISVYLSNVEIKNCDVVINGCGEGIYAKSGLGETDGTLTIDNAHLEINANRSAISGMYELVLGEGLFLLEPSGAVFVPTTNPEAELGEGEEYNFDNIQVDGVVQRHVIIGKSSTGVEGIYATQYEANGAIYDIQGRRLEHITQPGFYIVNGKKILVK
ncbi:MAG: hypothetical protein ACI4BC_02685 [Muribaculaceae bacterium]